MIVIEDQSVKNEQGYMVCRWFVASNIAWVNSPYGYTVGTGSTRWKALVDLNEGMCVRHFDRVNCNIDYWYGVRA